MPPPEKLHINPNRAKPGDIIAVVAPLAGAHQALATGHDFSWTLEGGAISPEQSRDLFTTVATGGAHLNTSLLPPGRFTIRCKVTKPGVVDPVLTFEEDLALANPRRGAVDQADAAQVAALHDMVAAADGIAARGLDVNVRPSAVVPSDDQALWTAIRASCDQRSFSAYEKFLERLLCRKPADPALGQRENEVHDNVKARQGGSRRGVQSFEMLKAATEGWLALTCRSWDEVLAAAGGADQRERIGFAEDPAQLRERMREYLAGSVRPSTLPYLGHIVTALGLPDPADAGAPHGLCAARSHLCFLELIWSYWHEEGMLAQGLNAIALRFQNRAVGGALAGFELDPLRPLNNLLWGYIQDAPFQLTVRRRAYEYEHEYGLPLLGKAVGTLAPADRRSTFIEAFHDLLRLATRYYTEASNRLVDPDPFPVLNAIRAVHLVLSEGAHNQFGDLPSTARIEMLIQQWLLAQTPMREFLRTRAMTAYPEPWMGPLDALKQQMGWTEASSLHFHALAEHGERLLLSLRFGDWNATGVSANQAQNWLRYWRTEIHGYVHAYRAVTGVDLTSETATERTTAPAHLLRRRLQRQLAS